MLPQLSPAVAAKCGDPKRDEVRPFAEMGRARNVGGVGVH